MSLPQSMPSLFGRFTAIWQDHEHLRTTLRELKALCAALDDGLRWGHRGNHVCLDGAHRRRSRRARDADDRQGARASHRHHRC